MKLINIINSCYFKKVATVFLITIIANSVFCQINLVRNGNFDTVGVCPTNSNKQPPLFWYQAGKKVNCFAHSCSPDIGSSTPYNYIGGDAFQVPRSGNGYIGLLFSNLSPKARSYLQTELIDSMSQGKCYYIEFYVNLANPLKYGTNNISALLTNNAKYYTDTISNMFGILSATPQIISYNNPIVIDTLNWVKISAVYIAQGGEKFLTLGNFLPDAQTQTKINNPSGANGCTYLFDDVSVIPLDSMPLKADAGKDTSISNVGDSVFIGSLTNGITNITWYNSSGAIINTVAPGFYVKPSASTFYIVEQTVCGYTSRDTVNVTVGTVPLIMLGFTVMYQPTPNPSKEGNVLLQWQTANEINVSHFNIQLSTNGKDFINIGQVKAQNKSSNEYNFTDNKLPTTIDQLTLYYRIESIDKDGKKQYSEVRKMELGIRNLGVSIYPNPAKDVVTIASKESIKEIKIINQLGQVVQQLQVNKEHLKLDVSQLHPALYLIKIVTQKNVVYNEKFIKQ